VSWHPFLNLKRVFRLPVRILFVIFFSVYALLFCNVCFSFISTIIIVIAAFVLSSFRQWISVCIPLNFFSQLFHVMTWSVVSIQRYLYITKADWLHQKFPEPTKLKVTKLSMGLRQALDGYNKTSFLVQIKFITEDSKRFNYKY
jgi:hypothetical protein